MGYIPEWMLEVKKKYKGSVANAFILTGNIGDYCLETKDLKKFLSEYITQKGEDEIKIDCVYFYDIETLGRRVLPSPKDQKDEVGIPWKEFMEKITETRILEVQGNDGRMGQKKERNAFVFFYPQFLIPGQEHLYDEERTNVVSLHRVLSSSEFINSNNIVFIVSESVKDIHTMFTGSNSKTVVVEIPLPGEEARREFIKFCMERQGRRDKRFEKCGKRWPLTQEQLVNLTAGLQLVAIEDVLLAAFTKEKKKMEGILPEATVCLDRESVMARKKEVIQKEYGDVIEILDTAGYSLEQYAGQEELKGYFKEVVIPSFLDKEIAMVAPKGMIMMGPPGTGKTYFARCMAGSAGISFLEFKMSKILGKYVGESEKSMEKALSVFRALAPVGVFIDEMDQVFPIRSEGGRASSVNSNLFGMILSEMSKAENRGRILWIGATNFPNNVDEALKRAGRFDKKIPFFAPNQKEREQVFRFHIKKSSLGIAEDEDLSEIIASTEGYTQAEIEAVVVKALELRKRKQGMIGAKEALFAAQGYMVSAQNRSIKEMEKIALMECNDAEFIPEDKRALHRKLMHLDGERSEISDTIDRIRDER